MKFPFSPFQINYVHLLFLAAPLWLVPLSWSLLNLPAWVMKWWIIPASLLAIAYSMTPGLLSGLLALAWLLFCISVTWIYFQQWKSKTARTIASWCLLAAFCYLPVGGVWAVADRLDFRFLDFDATIGMLTAVHFHYAGFLLPLLTGLLLAQQKESHFIKKVIGYGVIAGVPMVAIGITASHFQLPPPVEVIAVSVMVFAGMSVGGLYIKQAFSNFTAPSSWLWLCGGLALIGGMSLALLYGWRYYFPLSFLSIPWMYAVHGTLNAIGFALPGVLGWRMQHRMYQ